ncbi:MAG: glycosyltransferase family 2 protein [Microthrixaceae bacterium]
MISPSPEARPSATVVICAYTEDRIDDIVAAVESVRGQASAAQVLLVIDHNPRLLATLVDRWADVEVVPNSGQQGLSGARNTGVALAQHPVIAFLDDDAVAEPTWLAALVALFADPDVFAAGGTVTPAWDAEAPTWLPSEFLWVVGCSWSGLPTERGEVRNPIGASMAIRRDVFALVGGFQSDLGRVGRVPLGCEETELCVRAQAAMGGKVLYEPAAVVHHRVPATRASVRYFFERCYAEGRSKAIVSRLAGAQAGLSAERSYVTSVLPRAALRELARAARADGAAAARLALLLLGTLVTTAGFVSGTLRRSSGPVADGHDVNADGAGCSPSVTSLESRRADSQRL